MPKINDLVPSNSGAACLGIDSTPFDITSLMPFNHVHHVSGVVHDPLLGQSGVIRYSKECDDFEISIDGGRKFIKRSEINALTLQQAYDNGSAVPIENPPGNWVNVAKEDVQVLFGSTSARAPLRLSGLIDIVANNALGDVTMYSHAVHDPAATNEALRKAESIGPGTLNLDTGSGLINLSIGSGTAQYRNVGGTQSITATATAVAYPHDDFSDLNYSHVGAPPASTDDILINVAGLYECIYSTSWEQTSAGNRLIIRSQATLNGTEIGRTRAYSYSRDTDHGFGTNRARFLFAADAGDVFKIQTIIHAGFDTSQMIDGEAWVVLRRIGPKRGEN